jgi:hypothetical protein
MARLADHLGPFRVMTGLLVQQAEVGVCQGQPARNLAVFGCGTANVLERGNGLFQQVFRAPVFETPQLSNAVYVVTAAE